jgi:hypothetical protein
VCFFITAFIHFLMMCVGVVGVPHTGMTGVLTMISSALPRPAVLHVVASVSTAVPVPAVTGFKCNHGYGFMALSSLGMFGITLAFRMLVLKAVRDDRPSCCSGTY